MSAAEHPWIATVRIDEIPDGGCRIELTADEATRAAAAATAGALGIARLEAAFDLERVGRDGLYVVGRVSATVRQTCVVTLEPIETEVDETFDLAFARRARPRADEGKIVVGAADPPEPLVDGVIDLAAIATEFLVLGVDPYPRKPGAVFEAPTSTEADGQPFAALAALRKGEGEVKP